MSNKPKTAQIPPDPRLEAIEQRLDGISSRLNNCVSNEELTRAIRGEGWRKYTNFLKNWIPVGVAVAVGLFVLAQYGDYREFRGVTTKGLSDVESSVSGTKKELDEIRSDLLTIRARIASARPAEPQNQSEAKELLKDAKGKSVIVPSSVIEQTGKIFIREAEHKPEAWDVASDYLNYRSSQTTRQIDESARSAPGTKLSMEYTVDLPPEGKQKPDFSFIKRPVSFEQSARYERINENKNTNSPVGWPILIAEGGGVILDGHDVRHVIYLNVEIHYSGGPVILRDVTFVNCTFVVKNTAPSRRFSEALLTAADSLTFQNGA